MMDSGKKLRLETELKRNERNIEEFLKRAELLEERNNEIKKELNGQ